MNCLNSLSSMFKIKSARKEVGIVAKVGITISNVSFKVET